MTARVHVKTRTLYDSVLMSAACALCVTGVRWGARRTEFQTSASSSPITGREEGKDVTGMGGGVGAVLKHLPGYQPNLGARELP